MYTTHFDGSIVVGSSSSPHLLGEGLLPHLPALRGVLHRPPIDGFSLLSLLIGIAAPLALLLAGGGTLGRLGGGWASTHAAGRGEVTDPAVVSVATPRRRGHHEEMRGHGGRGEGAVGVWLGGGRRGGKGVQRRWRRGC